jgi:MGT family glycosyltransferase
VVKHLGFICPFFSGHLNPMLALARALRRRGYATSLLATPEIQPTVGGIDTGLIRIGGPPVPGGSRPAWLNEVAELVGAEAIRHVAARAFAADELVTHEGPAALREAKVDALVVDQVSRGGSSVARALGLPYVTVCNALAMYYEVDVPPWTTTWGYDPSPAGRKRNRLGYAELTRILWSARDGDRGRRVSSTSPAPPLGETSERPWVIVAQQPEFFDFPRRNLPPQFHYTGPFRDGDSEAGIRFPFDRLDGRPLIYASLGTLQNCLPQVFVAIAEACARLPAQLVISLGRNGMSLPPDLPGAPVVVPFAPQRELLRRTALVVTSAGLNTVLDSLERGVPMIAIPISHEQPGIAARIAALGVGEIVPLDQLSSVLPTTVTRVFHGGGYRCRAREAQERIARAEGFRRAVDLIDDALTTGRPVLRAHVPAD